MLSSFHRRIRADRALFAVSAALLILIPGPAVLYIVARSIHQGRAAGLMSALGVETGTLIHVAAATLGLSALLASSAAAFSVVKYAGAAYLLYLGVRTLLTRQQDHGLRVPVATGRARGVCVRVLGWGARGGVGRGDGGRGRSRGGRRSVGH